MNYAVGDTVRIMQLRPGGHDQLHGRGSVRLVSSRSVTLHDGTRWRLDGYEWGSTPERGVGRSHARRIEKVEA